MPTLTQRQCCLVDLDTHEITWRGSVDQFFAANEFAIEDLTGIVMDLLDTGATVIGGGAMPSLQLSLTQEA